MSYPRTTASVRTDHIYLLSNFVGRLQAGVTFAPTAYELTALGNLAGALNAAVVPQSWPSPPGVAPLDDAQKSALFAAECGIGPMSAFDATTPGMDEGTRNVYRQFYGPSAQGWPEVQYWYAHR